MKKIGKILLWILAAALAAAVLSGAAAGIKYYRVVHSNAQVTLTEGPECRDSAGRTLGEKLIFETVFRVPWGIRPLSMSVTPAPGSQLAAAPVFQRVKCGWGTNLWKSTVLLQYYRQGAVKESPAQAVFSNRQTIELKLPALQISPPQLRGDQLELAGAIEPGRKSPEKNLLLWIFAGLLILAVIILTVLHFLKRERKRTVPPWEKALSAIQSLLDKVRAGTAPPEQSLALLTDIVREYLERRFQLRAERQTTAEFMSDLECGKGNLADSHRNFLRDFLTAADLVKFARLPADRTGFENAARKAEELIRETTPAEPGKENPK